MGSRGPVPKRSEDRKRRNKNEGTQPVKVEVPVDVRVSPFVEANPEWCGTVSGLWESLSVSGQARFYEPSDWAFARLILDELDEYVRAERKNGQILASLLSGLGSLLVSEGDRRRAGIELSHAASASTGSSRVESMEKWKSRVV